jgi:AraC-like DNA-binding protein
MQQVFMEQDENGQLFEADASLSGIVSHFYQIFQPAGTASIIKHLSPSLEMLLIFNFGPPVPVSFKEDKPGTQIIDKLAVIGPLSQMLNYEVRAGADGIVVNFVLDGFYRLFQVPVAAVTAGSIIDTHKLVRQHYLEELWHELAALTDTRRRLQLLTSFMHSIAAPNEPAALPLLAGEAYFHDPVIQPVKAIAADADLTERSVQLRFQKYAGYSPKELLRFLRFKAVIHHLLRDPAAQVDIFELITQYQYHDQSHLIKDFQYYLGTTPQRFLKQLKGRQFYITGQDKQAGV